MESADVCCRYLSNLLLVSFFRLAMSECTSLKLLEVITAKDSKYLLFFFENVFYWKVYMTKYVAHFS